MEGLANTDCHFFITASCTKGPSCPFRHNEAAKQTTAVCTSWRGGGICSLKCSYRHPDRRFMGLCKMVPTSAAPVAGDRSQTPCHFFAQGHCRFGAQCQFKHEGVEAVSLHAQARIQEQQAPPPTAPSEPKKGGDSMRALEILNKFSASNKASARGGSVTVRSVMPPSVPKQTSNGQGFGTLGRGGGGGAAPTQASRPFVQAPSSQPRQPAFQATPSASTAEKRKDPPTSTAPRLLTLSKSNSTVSCSQSGKADFEIPSFEEIIAAKRRREAAEGKALPPTPTPTLTRPPVFTPAPSASAKQMQMGAPVAAVRPAAPVAAAAPVPQLEVPAMGSYLDSDLPSFDEDDDGVFEEYRDLI